MEFVILLACITPLHILPSNEKTDALSVNDLTLGHAVNVHSFMHVVNTYYHGSTCAILITFKNYASTGRPFPTMLHFRCQSSVDFHLDTVVSLCKNDRLENILLPDKSSCRRLGMYRMLEGALTSGLRVLLAKHEGSQEVPTQF